MTLWLRRILPWNWGLAAHRPQSNLRNQLPSTGRVEHVRATRLGAYPFPVERRPQAQTLQRRIVRQDACRSLRDSQHEFKSLSLMECVVRGGSGGPERSVKMARAIRTIPINLTQVRKGSVAKSQDLIVKAGCSWDRMHPCARLWLQLALRSIAQKSLRRESTSIPSYRADISLSCRTWPCNQMVAFSPDPTLGLPSSALPFTSTSRRIFPAST